MMKTDGLRRAEFLVLVFISCVGAAETSSAVADRKKKAPGNAAWLLPEYGGC